MPHLQSASRAQPHPAAPNHTQPHRQGGVGLGRVRPGEVGRGWATSESTVPGILSSYYVQPRSSIFLAGFKNYDLFSFSCFVFGSDCACFVSGGVWSCKSKKVYNLWPALRLMNFSCFHVWFSAMAENGLFLEVSGM